MTIKAKAEDAPKTPEEVKAAEDEKEDPKAEEDKGEDKEPKAEEDKKDDKPEAAEDEDGYKDETVDDEKDPEASEQDDEEEEPKAEEGAPSPEKKKDVASIMGLPANASLPAQKARALALVRLESAVQKHTGKKNVDACIGALQALVDDASAVAEMRAQVKESKQREQYRERMDLLRKLSAANIPGYQRGDLFVDVEDKKTKKLVARPSAVYAEMRIGTLRALVEGKLAGRTASKTNPFEPNQQAAKQVQAAADNEQVVAANATVINRLKAKGYSEEKITQTLAALAAQGAL